MGRVTATVLFTGLVGSTELRSAVGEEAADELRRHHDRLLAQPVEAHRGRVVKGLGDGIMATFAGAADCVGAAVAIQQAVDRLNRTGKTPAPLAVRVGLSAGDVSFEDGDAHGTPRIKWQPAAASPISLPPLLTDVGRVFVGRDAELERLGQLMEGDVGGRAASRAAGRRAGHREDPARRRWAALRHACGLD